MDVTGIVLAGGRSTRFGRDKLVERVDAEPLLWRPIRVLEALCQEVVVATAPGRGYAAPPDLIVRLHFVEDDVPDAGPVEGLRAALTAAGSEVALVVGGDMPSLDPRDLERLIAVVEDGAVGASFGQPLPCSFHVDSARAVLALSAPRSLRALLAALGAVELPAPAPGTLRDVDEPGDLPLA